MSPGTAEPAKTVNILLQLVGAADIAADPLAGAAFSEAMGKAAAAAPRAGEFQIALHEDGPDVPAPAAIVLERSVDDAGADPLALIVPLAVPPAAQRTIAPQPADLPESSTATPPIPPAGDPARRQEALRQTETANAFPPPFEIAEPQADLRPSPRSPALAATAQFSAPDFAPVAPPSEAANAEATIREIQPAQKAVALAPKNAGPEALAGPEAPLPAAIALQEIPAAAPRATRHDFAGKTASSMSDAAPRPVSIVTSSVTPDGAIEVRLDPPDLGRVSIDFSADANGVVKAIIIADRADTLDLIRRHIDIFRDELSKQGFGDVDMSFRERGRDDGDTLPSPPKKWKHFAEAGFDLDAAMTGAFAAGGFDVVA